MFILDELFKTKTSNIIKELCLKFFCVKRYNIFKGKIKLLFDEAHNDINIIEKNFLKFYEINFFKGIMDKKGIDLNKVIKNLKGIMKYNNGDIFIGIIRDGIRDEKGLMIYNDGRIINGYLENDIKKEINYYEEVNLEENKLDNCKLNEKELNEFIKNLDLKTQFCQLHKYLIIGLCIDKDCKEKNKLICQKCLFKNHKKHDIIEIEEYEDKFKEKIIKEEKNISELKNKNNISDIYQTSELRKNINELIDQKIETFISSIHKKAINLKENSFNQKIIKLKKYYPIDNLDKQVEIINLILSIINNNFDNYINESINDILNAKINNIKTEISKILSIAFDNKDSNIYDIENFWTKEIFNPKEKEFNYELRENNYLAKKINGNYQIIKSNIKLKEGNIYIIIFNIIYQDNNKDFDIGFGNIDLLKTKKSIKENGGICLSNKGLFIDGKIIDEKIKIEKNDEICFILVLKEEKYFILFKNEKNVGKFNLNLTDIYALASIEKADDSVEIKTFIKL